jgi:predicted esterase
MRLAFNLDGEGPPLLLLHGVGGDGSTGMPLPRHFAAVSR